MQVSSVLYRQCNGFNLKQEFRKQCPTQTMVFTLNLNSQKSVRHRQNLYCHFYCNCHYCQYCHYRHYYYIGWKVGRFQLPFDIIKVSFSQNCKTGRLTNRQLDFQSCSGQLKIIVNWIGFQKTKNQTGQAPFTNQLHKKNVTPDM